MIEAPTVGDRVAVTFAADGLRFLGEPATVAEEIPAPLDAEGNVIGPRLFAVDFDSGAVPETGDRYRFPAGDLDELPEVSE